jgi:hypothetical protein
MALAPTSKHANVINRMLFVRNPNQITSQAVAIDFIPLAIVGHSVASEDRKSPQGLPPG